VDRSTRSSTTRAWGRGRLITLTSVGGIVGQPFNEAYCAAKFAVEGYMESLAPVAATTGVRVSVVEPGAVASEFVASQQLDVAKLLEEAGPYAPAMAAYIEWTQVSFGNAQTGTKRTDVGGSAVQNLTKTWVS
jgi:NAD(P)-dependent dehydrogenase (short-subunit alcohol dehydrogenase family)